MLSHSIHVYGGRIQNCVAQNRRAGRGPRTYCGGPRTMRAGRGIGGPKYRRRPHMVLGPHSKFWAHNLTYCGSGARTEQSGPQNRRGPRSVDLQNRSVGLVGTPELTVGAQSDRTLGAPILLWGPQNSALDGTRRAACAPRRIRAAHAIFFCLVGAPQCCGALSHGLFGLVANPALASGLSGDETRSLSGNRQMKIVLIR